RRTRGGRWFARHQPHRLHGSAVRRDLPTCCRGAALSKWGHVSLRLDSCGARRLAILEELYQAVQHAIHRRCNAERLALAQHISVEMIDLAAFATRNVLS